MRLVILLLLLSIFSTTLKSQNWYDEYYEETTVQNITNNYSNIWLNETFEGIIGSKYQRIQIRFTEIIKAPNKANKYEVFGKSKVNKNICDFKGYFIIKTIKTLADSTIVGADISDGMLWGEYFLEEDTSQNHVGQFRGDFFAKWSISKNNDISFFKEMYYNNEVVTFIGVWQDYDSNIPKKCNWGMEIPPESMPELFSYLENSYYTINSKYFERGWESYAIANDFIKVPKDYYSNGTRFSKDYIKHSDSLMRTNKSIESYNWWINKETTNNDKESQSLLYYLIAFLAMILLGVTIFIRKRKKNSH